MARDPKVTWAQILPGIGLFLLIFSFLHEFKGPEGGASLLVI